MSLLADLDVVEAMRDGQVVVDPYEPALLQPASLDVRLHPTFRRFREDVRLIDLDDVPPGHTETVDGSDGLLLRPGGFVLGSTVERVTLGDATAARVEGKSSLARLGLVVHVTGGFVDPGFAGEITLEIANLSPVPLVLRPGMPVAQLAFHRLSRAAGKPYSVAGHYNGQSGPTESRFWPGAWTRGSWVTVRDGEPV